MVLSDRPSLQEILWNFSRFKDEKKRLTLRDNPHFYTKLPTSLEAYGDSLKIDPTEDFQHGNKFYVLTDKPELVHVMIDRDLQSFGNFWCPKDSIIFKGLGVLFLSFSAFLDALQTSVGRSGGKGSSGHLLEAHAVGSANTPPCPPFQDFPLITVE